MTGKGPATRVAERIFGLPCVAGSGAVTLTDALGAAAAAGVVAWTSPSPGCDLPSGRPASGRWERCGAPHAGIRAFVPSPPFPSPVVVVRQCGAHAPWGPDPIWEEVPPGPGLVALLRALEVLRG